MQRFGDYDLVREIGHGGMGTVFKAVRSADGVVVAIKVFDVASSANREALAKRFLAEAKLTETLDHPNIVRTREHGILPDGRPYLVMDYIDGGTTLADRVTVKPLPPDVLPKIYREIRGALAYCHARGIVHADLKAENILLDRNGTALLADFGIARILDPETRAKISLTTSTLPANFATPYVIAPECVHGELATPTADIYAFGVILFKLVVGIWYEGSQRLLRQLGDLAPEWSPLLTHMLAKDPSSRIANAGELPEYPISEVRRRHPLAWIIAASALSSAVILPLLPRGESEAEPSAVTAANIRGGYVPYAVLTPADTLTLTGAVHFGTVVLPDTNGYVHVRAPKGFEGPLITADHAQGSLFSQFHVDREPGMRVIIRGNRQIIIKYHEPDTGNP